MPPKKVFTKEDIMSIAFQLTREEGLKNLSARTIAKRLNSSTMPIYSSVNSMKEVEVEIAQRCRELFIEYSMAPQTGNALLDSFLGYIRFAQEEKEFFRMMFFDDEGADNDAYQQHKEFTAQKILDHIKTAPQLAGLDEQQIRHLMERLRIVTHGIASLINYGRLEDLQHESMEDFLKELIAYFIYREKHGALQFEQKEEREK